MSHEKGRSGRGRGRSGPGGRSGSRGRRGGVARGDVRIAVLALLSEEPMHGYQIMSELADRSSGAWQPSPGSIYPLLQQLADEGLVTAKEDEGRKVFSLTDTGTSTAAESVDGSPIWERLAGEAGSIDLRQATSSLASAAKQVATSGTQEQVKEAADILADARKRLYRLLAE